MKRFLSLLFYITTTFLFSQNNTTYWQQHVDYTMDVDVNVEKYQFKGQSKHSYSFYLIPFKKGTQDNFITWSKLYINQN